MDMKPGYKQTEVGVISEDWEIFLVSYLGETKRGAGSLCIRYRQSGGVRLIRINDFFQDNPVFVEPTDEIMRYSIRERDLLFAGTGASAGASYLPKKEWIGLPHSYNAPRIRVFENHCKEYLLYSLQSNYVIKQQRAWFVGNAQPFLDTKAISSFSIAVPPTKAEQEAIAAALSDVDALITALDRLIAKKRDIKQAAMQELLTGKRRLPGFANDKGFKKTEIDEIPRDWDRRSFGDVAEVIMGQSPGGTSYNQMGTGVPLINGPTEFTDKYPIKIQWTTQPTKTCKDGDLLLCVRGSSTGRMNVSDDIYCIGRGVAAIRAKSGSDTRFLTYLLHSAIQRLLSFSTGSTFPNIDRKSISSIQIGLPSLSEQQSITSILSDMDAEIAALETRREKTITLKRGMMQELLTGRIRLV